MIKWWRGLNLNHIERVFVECRNMVSLNVEMVRKDCSVPPQRTLDTQLLCLSDVGRMGSGSSLNRQGWRRNTG